MKEVGVLKRLDHPNIVRLEEVIDCEESNKLYLVLEYARYGEIMGWNEETLKYSV
jgi:serine/threonine protein kinase